MHKGCQDTDKLAAPLKAAAAHLQRPLDVRNGCDHVVFGEQLVDLFQMVGALLGTSAFLGRVLFEERAPDVDIVKDYLQGTS